MYGLVCHKSLITQWLEYLIGVRKVIDLIPVGDSDFFLLHSCDMMIITYFLFHY